MGRYIWYSEEGTEQGPSPPRPLIAVPNVTAHPSAGGVPITALLYNGPLLCGFNVGIRGLKRTVGAVVQLVEYRTRNQEVAGLTHTRSTASNLEQVANLLCAQANSAPYPQRDGK